MYSDEMTHLENKLSGLGYRFMITKDGELIYSNLSDEDLEIARSVAGDAIDDAKTLTASRFEVSVIKSTFWHGEKYSVLRLSILKKQMVYFRGGFPAAL